MREIKICDVTGLDKRMYRVGVEVEDFEKEFINTLLKNAKFYTKGIKIIGSVSESYNRGIKLHLSDKQKVIFNRIHDKYQKAYDNRCTYYIYSKVIEDYGIKLEDYDRKTLESFKGEKETEEHKKWINSILLYG